MTDPQHNERIHKEPLNSAELGLFRQEREKELTHGNRGRSVMTARLDQVSGRAEGEVESDDRQEEVRPAIVTTHDDDDDEPTLPFRKSRDQSDDQDGSYKLVLCGMGGVIGGAIIATIICLIYFLRWQRVMRPLRRADD